MIPQKLERGDKIAVIAPSRSLTIITKDSREIACERLGELGLDVEFSEHAEESDSFVSSSIKSRIEDLEWAFEEKKFKAIMTAIGGFNSNQLLKYIDYDLIKSNPKILCGYSDITALQNAIYAKTGLVTYSGPHFSTFGMRKGMEYTTEYFKKCLMSSRPFEIKPSREWSDDQWYKNQNARRFVKNDGYKVLNDGSANGIIVGANLCTFNLLHGTGYMPGLEGTVLFLEDDDETRPHTFDRDLQSIIHQPGFDKVRGIVIGRFQNASAISLELLTKIVKSKRELNSIPVIANADFGHTTPQITFPVGGTAKISAKGGVATLEILKH